MRIGIFSQCYRPTTNGVVISIDTFRETLSRRGHEIFIIAPNTKKYQDDDPRHIIRLPSVAWPGQSYYPLALPWFSGIREKIAGLKLDIIHCQHAFTMGSLGLSIGRKLGLPVIYTYHTLIAEYAHYVPIFHHLAKYYLINASKRFCNKCDTVITPSPSMKRILQSYGVTKNIEVIPTGIRPERFKHLDPRLLKAKYQIADDNFILLYVGRLATEKNLTLLFETFEQVIKIMPNVHLLLVGGGPQEQEYRQWFRSHNLIQKVTFAGMQPKEETEKIFGAADIFTFPSLTDTQGIVITEAMAAGTPPIAANNLGPSDIINDGVDGYLVPPLPDTFALKIINLLKNPGLLKKFQDAGIRKANEYSAENSANKMENLYDRVTNLYRSKSDPTSKGEESRPV